MSVSIVALRLSKRKGYTSLLPSAYFIYLPHNPHLTSADLQQNPRLLSYFLCAGPIPWISV